MKKLLSIAVMAMFIVLPSCKKNDAVVNPNEKSSEEGLKELFQKDYRNLMRCYYQKASLISFSEEKWDSLARNSYKAKDGTREVYYYLMLGYSYNISNYENICTEMRYKYDHQANGEINDVEPYVALFERIGGWFSITSEFCTEEMGFEFKEAAIGTKRYEDFGEFKSDFKTSFNAETEYMSAEWEYYDSLTEETHRLIIERVDGETEMYMAMY